MRFGRLAVPVINDRPDYKFELGKGIVLREGRDLTIIANGLCVAPALEAAEKLAADGIDAKVINIHTIKPLDEDLVVAAAKETGKVVTVEEHSIIGGLGGAVCECLAEKAPVPVKRIGIHDVFGESGPALELLHKYGLDAEGIYKQISFCRKYLKDPAGDHICKCYHGGEPGSLQGKLLHDSGSIYNAGDMDVPYRWKIFLNTSTWVKCTISNGHIAQVFFLSKRSVYGDYKGVWMKPCDK